MGAASHLPIDVDPAKVGMWFGVVILIVGLIEANALLADKGATTKPIEKVSGVIHYGLLLAVIFYVLAEVLLQNRHRRVPCLPSAPVGHSGLFRGVLLALLPAALLAASAAELLSACNRKDAASADPAVSKGKALYFTHCIACHSANPAVDGTLGPAIKGSGLDLLKARVLQGTYPPGYTPKRETKIMRRLPLTEADVEALHAFLNAP